MYVPLQLLYDTDGPEPDEPMVSAIAVYQSPIVLSAPYEEIKTRHYARLTRALKKKTLLENAIALNRSTWASQYVRTKRG